MPDPLDMQVVQCNYSEGTSAVAQGAVAYISLLNPGGGNDRIMILARSRGGRLVHKWESIRKLDNFRVKTIPPEHPRYADARLWTYEPELTAFMLRMSREFLVDT